MVSDGHSKEQLVVFTAIHGAGCDIHVEFFCHHSRLIIDGQRFLIYPTTAVALATDVQQFAAQPVGNIHHRRGTNVCFAQLGNDVAPCLRIQLSFKQIFLTGKVGTEVFQAIQRLSVALFLSLFHLLIIHCFLAFEEVPYAEDFSTNQRVLCYAIEDANADGTTWEYLYEYGYMRISSGDKEKDDWLFTPFIAVKKDKTYKLSFDVRSIAVETIEVKYGIHPMASAMTEALLPVTSVDTDYDWKRLEQTFTATSDAPLFIGFHACNTDVAAGHSLYIDNVKVEEFASTGMEYAKKSQNYRVENGQLTVTGSHTIDTRIYRADGTMLFSGILRPGNVLSLPRGLVIVRVADEVAKLIVE